MNFHFRRLVSLFKTENWSRLKYLAELELEGTLSNEAHQSPKLAGTKGFMAIGALLGEPHSFMHDLESFFWVLFWICSHYNGRNEKGEIKHRKVTRFEKWNYEEIADLVETKTGLLVEEVSFDRAIAEFTPTCQPLIPCVQELRKCIFPDGKRWLCENKELYSQIKAVLVKAREGIVS